MATQMHQLTDVGQSIWLDNIRRSMFASGELRKLIDQGLRGMTSNPTIFEKAIGSGKDYDEQLRSLIGKETDPSKIFEALAIADIRSACDEFRPLFDSSHGADGFVSLEVSPTLAHDTKGTIDAAARLWKEVDRPNVMIKIPGTAEGVPAIRATIAAGINVNVTLLFSVDRYEAAAQAYIDGINDRVAKKLPVDTIASVASVFISRIDTAVDKLLDAKIQKGETAFKDVSGKTGIANSKLIYQRFLKLFDERFTAAKAAGAHVQRPLWASTGTKNPAYSDLMYVENLVGKQTVNTVPPQTLEALLDHGNVRTESVLEDLAGAHSTIDRLAKAGISLFDITEALIAEGVKSFADSFNAMLDAIVEKQKALAQGAAPRVEVTLGKYKADADAALRQLSERDFLSKLWKHDPEPWSAEPAHIDIIKKALGWVDIAERVHASAPELVEFAQACAKLFTHVVVLGMGGSSLAPDILRETFGKTPGFPHLHVLDSTDPGQVKALDDSLDIAKTVFIVASKSGTTTEPDAFFRYFYERVQKTVGAKAAGAHFVAITDPGTKLEGDAGALDFRKIWVNDPNIGGRYSALSYFGMVPAAMAGYDIEKILDRALGAMHANSPSVPADCAPALAFGAAIGSLAKSERRDKLTIVTHPKVRAFGAWAEQLVAESTGKSGTGIVPIEGEPLGETGDYGDDRVFVYVGAGLAGAAADDEKRLAALEAAGHPVIRLHMGDVFDIGEMFYTWEVATAAAGSILGIDAFDQPNVQESKDNTKRLLAEYAQAGKFNEPAAAVTTPEALVILLAGSHSVNAGTSLESAVAAIAAQIEPGDYVAFNAYIPMNHAHEATLRGLRMKVRDALKVATTVGFGPRFLHSTGQLHKGGPNSGVFFQITAEPPHDLAIPGMVGFRILERAQALGDFEALDKRNRRGVRIHISGDLERGLAALSSALEGAVTAKA
ncbi:MAG: bifunctional transaldolase/phosoglucose isomerase [Candidatus Velthaea sp.]